MVTAALAGQAKSVKAIRARRQDRKQLFMSATLVSPEPV
jgi:hypothetical protein